MVRGLASVASLIHFCCNLECRLDSLLKQLGYRRKFYSQKGQDKWLISRVFAGQRGGYFVEVGVGNGITHSNTYVLERDFGWTGLLIEADPVYAKSTRLVRNSVCVNQCADSQNGTVDFLQYGYMGGIVAADTDNGANVRRRFLKRRAGNLLSMPAVRLSEIFSANSVPSEIDYLSIDVEGAEHRVLQGLSFEDYKVKAITVERPTPEVHSLLSSAGFVLARYWVFEGFYLANSVAKILGIEPLPFTGCRKKPC